MRKSLIAIVAVLVMAMSACGGSGFDIKGGWKSVGESGWGQAQPGAIVQFGDGKASLFSPSDTYAFYQDGEVYKLDVTGLLGGNSTFIVKVLDDDNIELYRDVTKDPVVVLKRVS